MTQLRNFVVALVGFTALTIAAPAVDVELANPSTLEAREPPCRCYAGTYAWLCGFERDDSPGHLTGDCNPNNVYLCIGGGGTASMIGKWHQPL
jgi:hypothetical protein